MSTNVMRMSDVIQPEVFNAYVVAETTERSALCQSGVIAVSEEMDALASGPNTLVNMPYLENLGGESGIMNDTGMILSSKIGANMDIARKDARTMAWGATGLAAALSGVDPLAAVAEKVADFWVADAQRMLLAKLEGVFATNGMKGKILDITEKTGNAALFSAAGFVDANQLMGDAKDSLTVVAMHSAVEAYLAKQALIEYETFDGKDVRVPTYMGKRVIVDDSMPYDPQTKLAAAYLFGEGAFVMGNGSHPRILQTEIVREGMASSGEDFLVNRRVFILHPKGIKWTESSVDNPFPSNAELADADNWQRVFDEKAIKMVRFDFKVA